MLCKVNRAYWVNFIFTLKWRIVSKIVKNNLQNESFKSDKISGKSSRNFYFLEIGNERLLINRFGLHSSAGAGNTEAIRKQF